MMRYLKIILALMLGLLAAPMVQAGSAPAQPTLYANGWTIILVPSVETQKTGNGLTIGGLNFSLRLGQQLNTLTAGLQTSLRQVYALNSISNDMAPLETVQPFAILNNLPLNVQGLDPTSYNNPAWFVQNLVGNQPPGIYVIGASADLLPALLQALGTPEVPPVSSSPYYVVVTGAAPPFAATAYATGLPREDTYPKIALPPLSKSCDPHTKFTVPAPAGFAAFTNQTVHLVRHVEAHPTSNFENGNYVCQGQWRALGSTEILLEGMGAKLPDFVFTPNPASPIGGCSQQCSYVRPALTVAPFASRYNLPLTLASFPWSGYQDLASSLFDSASPLFPHPSSGSRILVGWEHGNIQNAVTYLIGTLYRNPAMAARIPKWSFDDYDTIWTLETDAQGNLTFSNNCEKIPSASLPSTCPAFFP